MEMTLKKPSLRGPRYRKARRRLRRQSTPGVTWMHPIEFEGLLIELGVDNTTIILPEPEPVEREVISIELPPYACHVCKATGDDPCVTKTGNKAKQRHAGRDIL